MIPQKAGELLDNLIEGSRTGDFIWRANTTGNGFATAIDDTTVDIRREQVQGLLNQHQGAHEYVLELRGRYGRLIDSVRGVPPEKGLAAPRFAAPTIGDLLSQLFELAGGTDSQAEVDRLISITKRRK